MAACSPHVSAHDERGAVIDQRTLPPAPPPYRDQTDPGAGVEVVMALEAVGLDLPTILIDQATLALCGWPPDRG